MSRTYALNSVQVQSNIRLASFVFGQAAFRGQVGTGGFTFDDTSGIQDLPAMKAFTADESAATPTRFFAGFTAERSIVRGPLTPAAQRQWDVTVEDQNAFLDDLLIGSTGNRSEETDYARITWLLSEASMAGVAVGVVPNTNTVTMGASDYRGEHPRKVLEDCAQKSGKNFFLYDTGTGYLLWYDLSSSSSLTSTLSISDDPADVDSVTVFGPSSVSYRKDPARVFSTVRLEYTGGNVTVTNAATATTFRTREARVESSRVKTSARATELAQKQLDNADSEQVTVACSVSVPASLVTAIRAGMRIQLKLRHAGITSYTYHRVKTCAIMPRPGDGGVSDVEYLLRLELMDAVRPTRFETDDEPDDTGDDEGDAALSDVGGAITLTIKESSLLNYPAGSFAYGYGVVGAPKVRSTIQPNTAYTVCGCPLGAGGWGPGTEERITWFEYTPTLTDAMVGVKVTFSAASTVQGKAIGASALVAWADSQPSDIDDWLPIGAYVLEDGGTFVIPRSLVTTGATNWIGVAPSWAANPLPFFCAQDLVDGATGPIVGGEGQSGGSLAPSATAVAVGVTGTGVGPWVSGRGAVNGTNDAFVLVNWTGTGVPQAMVNGLILPSDAYSYTTTTVTLKSPPASGSVVLFRYRVSA